MNDTTKVPADYVGEQVREAIAREAHELGIIVGVSDGEVLLDGCVETEQQRAHVEEIARRVVGDLRVKNRITLVNLAGAVKKESLT